MTITLAFAACQAAESHVHACFAKTLTGDKEQKKTALKTLKEAQVTFQMALLNLYRATKAERLETI